MITQLYLYSSAATDPWHNLAVEEQLLRCVRPGSCILYLWQNYHTVVIGKNQNAFAECRTTLLEQEGGRLARRISGGGAVYHDGGNLNFTFLMPSEDYDLPRQLSVLVTACRSLGIPAELSGRNDILCGGRKFSGNAFYRGKAASFHHGTLLISADTEKMGRYLSPSRAKLQAKGVSSVRSRVMNLREAAPELTVNTMGKALTEAFSQVYGLPLSPLPAQWLDGDAVAALEERNRSWEWNYGSRPVCTASAEGRFSWGGAELLLTASLGKVTDCRMYTDAMEQRLPEWTAAALTGVRFTPGELAAAAGTLPAPYGEDLRSLLEKLDL